MDDSRKACTEVNNRFFEIDKIDSICNPTNASTSSCVKSSKIFAQIKNSVELAGSSVDELQSQKIE